VAGDQLIGHVVEVVADDLRLRPDAQNVVARALDQGRFPACGDGAKGVPGVAGDETELRRLDKKALGNLRTSEGFS
jgi:hypothetical protein